MKWPSIQQVFKPIIYTVLQAFTFIIWFAIAGEISLMIVRRAANLSSIIA
jgi:hypothetical protein